MDFTEKMKRCHEYMEALEEERRKIQVFQRELPLSLDLINQAIENCRQKIEKKENCGEEMEEEEEEEAQTTTCNDDDDEGGPVLEEFIPLKRTPSSSDFNNKHSIKSNIETTKACSNNKADWMKSVQLWNQNPDPVPKQDLPKKTPVIESKKNGGAFHPFHKSKEATTITTATAATPTTTTTTTATTPPSSIATSSTTETITECAENNNNNSSRRGEEKERQGQGQSSSRKTRRCWSPELHRRFCQALQQLGGAHVATPKQIRELMKVDGLTNDEVKSHLQKYRLHTRRPSPTIHSNGNPHQPPQFVVVGGIWVPPQEYSAAVAAKGGDSNRGGSNTGGIYAPVALQPQAPSSIYPHNKHHHQQQKQLQLSPTSPLHCDDEGRTSRADRSMEDNEDDNNDAGNCSSPSMSSYTHNSTVSALSL